MNVKVCDTHLKNELDYQMLLYMFLFTQIDGKTLQKQFSGWKKYFRSKHFEETSNQFEICSVFAQLL